MESEDGMRTETEPGGLDDEAGPTKERLAGTTTEPGSLVVVMLDDADSPLGSCTIAPTALGAKPSQTAAAAARRQAIRSAPPPFASLASVIGGGAHPSMLPTDLERVTTRRLPVI